jgi:hypothetical protein
MVQKLSSKAIEEHPLKLTTKKDQYNRFRCMLLITTLLTYLLSA